MVTDRRERCPADADTFGELAQTMLDELQRRSDTLGTALFNQPIWTMLLELYIHEQRGDAVGSKMLVHASGLPETTARRYLRELARDGWVERRAKRNDRRVIIVTLAAEGRRRLEGYFATFAGRRS